MRGTATYSEGNYIFSININLHFIFSNTQQPAGSLTWLPQSALHSHQPSSQGEGRKQISISQRHQGGRVHRGSKHLYEQHTKNQELMPWILE